MSMIQIEHLTFSYPGSCDAVFEDINLRLDTDWKLGLVGRNGRGKTTLLRLLLGQYEYSGHIRHSVPFDYFPCPVAQPHRWTEEILQEICPQAEQWEILRELSLLEVDADVLWRPFDTLSGGEQVKVLLAALFRNEGHFLLIDEPTNHLDAAACERVAAYLSRQKGFILVSHDRRFLDGCVDHILALNRSGIELCSGTFSSWMTGFTQRQAAELAQNDRLKKEIGRLRQAAGRTAVWSDRAEASKAGALDKGYVGHRAAKMMQRSKSIDARRQKAAEAKAGLLKDLETAEALKLTPLPYHTATLATLHDVAVCFEGRTVNAPVSFSIQQGDRIAICGRNGSGKTSLLKLLAGQAQAHTGTISIGAGLVVSRVPQDTAHLCGSVHDFSARAGIDKPLFLAILRKLGFKRIQFEKDMRAFSAGQKKKVLIARSLCEHAHMYIWDEPLNFIDIVSRMQIEQLLTTFLPTMVFVEHDGAFRDTISTKTISL